MNGPLEPRHEAGSAWGFAGMLVSDGVWMTAVALAAYVIFGRTMGTSPTAWSDTLIENFHITNCLVRNACTGVGVGATVGIFHSAGYLHWRTLLEGLGVHADGTYHTLLALNAVGVALTALVARRLAGPVAGALAALGMVMMVGIPTQLNVITDLAPMPFLGAVYLLLAHTSVARPALWRTALLGGVAGVLANVYATGLLCGLSGVWIALLLPARRRAHLAVAVASFACATFLLSPFTWLVDAQIFFSRPLGNGQSVVQNSLFHSHLARMTGLAAGVCALAVLASVLGFPWLRRKLDVPLALLLPLFAPLAVGSWLGKLDPQPKYCAHVLGAVAVTLAVALVGPVRVVWRAGWRRVTTRLPRLAPMAHLGTVLEGLTPWVAAGLIATGRVSEVQTEPVGNSFVTFDDLASVARVLTHARGWSLAQAALNLKAPDDIVRRAAYRWTRGWRPTGGEDRLERAYLLKLPAPLVSRPLPPNVVEAASSPLDATLLVFTCSWIDWRAFRVCSRAAGSPKEHCTPSGLPTVDNVQSDNVAGVAGMPPADGRSTARLALTLHLPLHPSPQCPEEWIYMPRLPIFCPGRITGVDGSTSPIEEDGQWARLAFHPADGQRPPRDLAITWDVGGPACWRQFRGYPPFFVEGDPQGVSFLANILAHQQEWGSMPQPPAILRLLFNPTADSP